MQLVTSNVYEHNLFHISLRQWEENKPSSCNVSNVKASCHILDEYSSHNVTPPCVSEVNGKRKAAFIQFEYTLCHSYITHTILGEQTNLKQCKLCKGMGY